MVRKNIFCGVVWQVWQSPRCTILFPFGKGHVAQLWGRWSAWSLQPAASSELASAKQCGLFTQSPTLPNYMHLVMSEYVCMCVSVKAQHMGHTGGGGTDRYLSGLLRFWLAFVLAD